jgi:Zn-dependent protease
MTTAEAPTPRGGVRLGRVLGVPVFIGPTWFLMAAFLTWSFGQSLVAERGQTSAYVVSGSFAVLLGLSVLLHEIGHCVVARMLGLSVRRITVNFLAGATEVTEAPQTPAREYAVAVVGPMVSLLLAGVGAAAWLALDSSSIVGAVAANVAFTNGLIAVFNLLPGLPLDGGRVLRALVWSVWGDADRATWAAAWAGRILAMAIVPLILLVLPALGYSSPSNLVFGLLVAAYIYSLATATLRRSQAMTRLPAVTVAGLARRALRVPADMPLAEAVRRAHAADLHALVVVDSADRLEAVVSEAAVLATPEQRRPWVAVGALARRIEPGLLLDPRLGGEPLLQAMRAHPAAEYVTQDPATGEVRVLVADDVAKALTA